MTHFCAHKEIKYFTRSDSVGMNIEMYDFYTDKLDKLLFKL